MPSLVNSSLSSYFNDGSSYEFGGSLVYNHNFRYHKGRSYSLFVRYNYSNVEEDGNTYTDNNYYLPHGWMFRKISSANYFGEILEWAGFAILTWSVPGAVFLLWSFANIVPRSKAVYARYTQFFGEEFTSLKRYKIFPYIY